MRILSDYRIEYEYEKNGTAYRCFSVASPVFRILTIISVFPSILVTPYFVIGVALSLIASFLCDFIAKKCVCTVRIASFENLFSVSAISLDGEEKEIFSCENAKIDELTYGREMDFQWENYTSKKNVDGCKNLFIESRNRKIVITADDYMYALVEERRKNGDISR